ncbi:hypothetical protein C2G38_2100769 [Gigaspora rosea]|uniref:Uncharacterized protein n=1 Tax=Gigaspora rosea TaxID=44941 RepID=A0A397URT0_9GLOM|nr:hypothetical protein C2G38_2100769 [Gigaspora rosea]
MNATLIYLNISENNLGFEGSKVLIEALNKNITPKTLKIGRINISFEGQNNIRQIFYKNFISTFVDLI